MSKWYGSIDNRLEENRQFCDEIKVGTGVTEYGWSDRYAYEVIEVIDQKHVIIRELKHELAGEPMSNKWNLISNPDGRTMEVKKRGKYWYTFGTLTAEELQEWIEHRDELAESLETTEYIVKAIYYSKFDWDKVLEKGKQTKYHRQNLSFGKADYYYDYSF